MSRNPDFVMDKVRRTIRRVKTSAEQTFDDQLWPINVVLVVMAAFIAGLALASDTSVLFKTLLVSTLAAVFGALIYGVCIYHGKIARRFQFSCAMALLLFLCIVVSSGYVDVFVAAPPGDDDPTEIPPEPQRELVIVQEYVDEELLKPDEQQDFEKPVETEKTDESAATTAASKQDVPHPVAAKQPTNAASDSRVTDPKMPKLARTDAPESAATRKPTAAKSNKVDTQSKTDVQQVDAPELAAEAPKTPQQPTPKTSNVARREEATDAQRQVTKPDPQVVVKPAVTAIERRVDTPERATTPTRPSTEPAKKAIAKAEPTNTTPVEPQPNQVVRAAKPEVSAPAATSVTRQTTNTTSERASVSPVKPAAAAPSKPTSNLARAADNPESSTVRSVTNSSERAQLPTKQPAAKPVEQIAARAPTTPNRQNPSPQASAAAVSARSSSGRVSPGRKAPTPEPTKHVGPSTQQVAKTSAQASGGSPQVAQQSSPAERASSPGAKTVASTGPVAQPELAAPQSAQQPSTAKPTVGAVARTDVSAPGAAASRRALEVNASSPTQAVVGGPPRAAQSPQTSTPNASHTAKSQPTKSKTTAQITQSRVDSASTPVTSVTSTTSPTVQAAEGTVSRQVQADNLPIAKHSSEPIRTAQQHVSTDDSSVSTKADASERPTASARSIAAKTRNVVDRAEGTPSQIEQPQLDAIASQNKSVTATPESGDLSQSIAPNAGTQATRSQQLVGTVKNLAGAATVEGERAAAENQNVGQPQSQPGQSSREATDLADATEQPSTVDAPTLAAQSDGQPKDAPGPAGTEAARTTDLARGDGQPQRAAGDAPAASRVTGAADQPAKRETGDDAKPTIEATAVAPAPREATPGAKVNASEVNAPEAAPVNAVAGSTNQPVAGGPTGAERAENPSTTGGAKTSATETTAVAATTANTTGQRAAEGQTAAPQATQVAAKGDRTSTPTDAVVQNVKADVVAPGRVETTGPTVAVNAAGKTSQADRSVAAAQGTPNRTTQGAAQGAPKATADTTALARETAGNEGPAVERHESAVAKAAGPSGIRDTAIEVAAVAPVAAVGPNAEAIARSPVAGASRRKVRATLPTLELPTGDVGGRIANVTQPTFNLSKKRTNIVAPAIDRRFITKKEVGGGQVDARVRADAFRQRATETPLGDDGFSSPTEPAIEQGLAFLARYQKKDGRWSLHDNFGGDGDDKEVASSKSDTAATGLALLSYLGAGYDPVTAQRYRQQIRDGLDYLIRNQREAGDTEISKAEDGDFFVPADETTNKNARLYSHAIATMAICEAYGMTQDPRYRKPAQRAIDFIVRAQNKKLGGWRYHPGFMRHRKGSDSDTSVTGWMVTALKSGEAAGLKVPKESYELTEKWLKTVSDKGEFGYAYNPLQRDKGESTFRGWRRSSKPMTAVGLLIEMYFGRPKADSRMVRGAQYLRERLPQVEDGFVDTYYWYYATQVMKHMGGEYWEDWKRSIRPMLLDNQVKQGPLAGSWSPTYRRGVTNRWGDDRWGKHGGRIYVTCLNLLTLEVDYRLLPLYQTEQ